MLLKKFDESQIKMKKLFKKNYIVFLLKDNIKILFLV